jgi:hypothetical protein
MTLRYMKHAPEAYFAEYAALIADSLAGGRNTGTVALKQSPKPRLKRV